MTFTQKVKQIILLIFGLSVAHLGVTFFIQANLGTDPFNVLVQGIFPKHSMAGCTSLDSRTHSYDDLLSDHTGTACD